MPTSSLNLLDRYQTLSANRKVIVTDPYVQGTLDINASPITVWDWLNDPHKRVQYTFQEGLEFREVFKVAGRRQVGAQTHCIHGKDVAMEETLLDWKPFDYLTVEQRFWGVSLRLTLRLEPLANGQRTRLTMLMDGKSWLPGPLNPPMMRLLLTRVVPIIKLFEKMKGKIEAVPS